MLALAPNAETLFLARILDGITGGNIIVAQAYITDITVITSYSIHYTKLYEAQVAIWSYRVIMIPVSPISKAIRTN